MAKLTQLFDSSKYEKRKTADQEEFEKLHKRDFPMWKEIMHEAFKMTKEESSRKQPHFKDKNYHATVMSGNIQGLLKERFPNEVKIGAHDRLMFSRKGKYCIYFKKLDDRKMPNNVKTEYVELIAYQKTIAGGDKMPIVFVGYCVDDEWFDLTGIYAVFIDDNKRAWVSIIDDNATGNSGGVSVIGNKPIAPIAPKSSRVRKKAE